MRTSSAAAAPRPSDAQLSRAQLDAFQAEERRRSAAIDREAAEAEAGFLPDGTMLEGRDRLPGFDTSGEQTQGQGPPRAPTTRPGGVPVRVWRRLSLGAREGLASALEAAAAQRARRRETGQTPGPASPGIL